MTSTQYIANKEVMKNFLNYTTMMEVIRQTVSAMNLLLRQPNLLQIVSAWAKALTKSTVCANPCPIHRFSMTILIQLTAPSLDTEKAECERLNVVTIPADQIEDDKETTKMTTFSK